MDDPRPETVDAPALRDERLQGIEFTIARFPRASSIEEAAAQRAIPVSSLIKSMVVRRADGDYVFVLVPGDRVIDWPKLRSVLGERRLSMPDAADALAATGYERGSITPFGASTRWPVIADERAVRGTISMGSGAHGVSITANGADIVRALDAVVADITTRSN